LPLAIRLAGARLAHRPRWRVADLVRRLGEAVLPELAVEDRTVGNAFALSYGQLSGSTRRFFSLLGLHPAASLDAPAAAALSGLPLDEAGDLLDELVDVHLLEEPEPGVYRMHDLLREFAAALAAGLPAEDRDRAVLGVLNLETHALTASVARSYRRALEHDLREVPDLRPELVAAIADPVARLERHRPDLGSFLEAAVRSGHPAYAWWIPRAAWYLLYYRGYNQDVAVLHDRGFAIAREHGDDAGTAMMANYGASVHYRNGAYEKARECLELCIRLHERQGDQVAVAGAYGNLASIEFVMGRYAETVETASKSLRISLRVGFAGYALAAHTQLSRAHGRLGNYAEALRLDRLRLLMASHDGDHLKASSLLQIQRHKRRLGRATPENARRYVEIALAMSVRRGLSVMEAEARTDLGTILAELGDFEAALAEHRRAVEISGQTSFAAELLHDYAATLHRSGDVPAAREAYERSLRIAREVRQPYSVARALAGIAGCLDAADPQRRRLRAEALALFEQMGVPERFSVRDPA
ncbi:tetratricopeptide repeat protein, partial [Actinoplanes sp. NPDC024001]|uniref:tetratricopeptide repeat protein n=1 Tax=Actinoplanes sp. NPDC024001 TaxID=3154598 RepID=UPI0034031FF6